MRNAELNLQLSFLQKPQKHSLGEIAKNTHQYICIFQYVCFLPVSFACRRGQLKEVRLRMEGGRHNTCQISLMRIGCDKGRQESYQTGRGGRFG